VTDGNLPTQVGNLSKNRLERVKASLLPELLRRRGLYLRGCGELTANPTFQAVAESGHGGS
jgi:hypothetical protein